MAEPEGLFTITINGINYRCQDYRSIQQGQKLVHEWKNGFAGGMGDYLFKGDQRYYMCLNLDASRSPELRLRPQYTDEITLTTAPNMDFPAYGFLAQSPNGTVFLYLFNDHTSYKIQVSDGTVDEEVDHGGGVLGRPALFAGTWYIARGDGLDAATLTITNAGGAADTFTAITGIKALHFAVTQEAGIARLARAHATNQISFSSDGAAFAPSPGHEVDDSSLAITDLWPWQGELVVSKVDSVFRFDFEGNARSIQGYVGRSLDPLDNLSGSNSFVHGAYFYWCHSSGLWRFSGLAGRPIGFEAAPDWWAGENLDTEGVEDTDRWYSIVAAGRWAYASRGSQLFFGYIRDDGSVNWHGYLMRTGASPGGLRLILTEQESAAGYYLWLLNPGATNHLRRIELITDGSIKNRNSKRGEASMGGGGQGKIFLPNLDFGEPEREKQLRRVWVGTRNWVSTASSSLHFFKNRGATLTNIGSSDASAGDVLYERTPTIDGTELFYSIMLLLRTSTDADYDPATSDPTIYLLGLEAATATIYRVVIPVFPDALISGQSVPTVRDALRDLKNGLRVAIVEPGPSAGSFNGYILGIEEKIVGGGSDGQQGWEFSVLIQRWDY